MNNQYLSTGIEAELERWRLREERLSKLLSFPLSSNIALLKEKLTYYERVAAKHRRTSNADERFALIMLHEERRRIEKQVYRHLLTRFLRKMLIAPWRRRKAIRRDKRKNVENSRAQHQQLQRNGFPGLSVKIDEQIRQGQQRFSIPVSYYLNESERLDHQLSFVKDQAGRYHFEGYKTTLYNETRPEEKRQQYFSMRQEHNINANEAYNLLSGRSIQNRGIWLQLDFNDKDSNGNFRVKQFHTDYGYNLEEALQRLPLKEQIDRGKLDTMKRKLQHGDRISVSFIKDGNEQPFYIDANPQFKSVNIYDGHYRKTTLQTAFGNKAKEVVKVTHEANEQQQQAKKNGMRIR